MHVSWTRPAGGACAQMFIMCGIAIAADETSIFICDRRQSDCVYSLVPASAGSPLFFPVPDRGTRIGRLLAPAVFWHRHCLSDSNPDVRPSSMLGNPLML